MNQSALPPGASTGHTFPERWRWQQWRRGRYRSV